MTQGGFRGHHFGKWFSGDSSSSSGCAVALGTDDVGVFESALSNEYFLAADAFGLGRGEVVGLAKGAVGAAFGGKGRGRMERLIAGFERRVGGGGRGVAG